MIGIADAGIDHGLRANSHCQNVCLLIILVLISAKIVKILFTTNILPTTDTKE
jgi:hypothetical protein